MKNKKSLPTVRQAFTLIELLIVIAIIGIIAAVVVLGLAQSAKEKARIAANLKFADSVRAQLSSYEIAWWKFEGNVNDTWGSNDGTLSGATFIDSEISGSAINFDGNDSVNFGNSIQIADEGAVELWVKISVWPTGSKSTLIGKHNWRWHIGINSGTRKLAFTRWSPWQYLGSAKTLELDTWYHFIFTINDDASNNAKLYVDGNLENSRTMTIPLGTAGDLKLSQRVQDDIDWHTGLMDEVRIYSKALTAQEIQQRYAESAPRHGIVLK